MTELRVVSDNTVSELPILNVQDIPGCVRAFADDLEAEFYGDVQSVISLIVRADGISILTYGENCSAYELMGLFEAAKLRVFAEDVIPD